MTNPEQLSPRLLILVPAYNEEGAIAQVVGSIVRVVPEADILVVDDGSADQTRLRAEAAGAQVVRHPFNLGIGGTVQTGLKFARQHHYDYVIRLDGDGQHDPDQIPMFLRVLQDDVADVVVGSRFLNPGHTMRIPIARRIGIIVFARTVSLLTREKATDTTSGYFGLNRKAIITLASFMPQDYPEVEGRVILHKARLRTIEIPTRMRSRVSGVSSINTWRSVYYALKVTVAALVCALKEIPRTREEMYHGDTIRTAPYRGSLQPHFGGRDHPADP